MGGMLGALADPILPIFAVMAVGVLFGRLRVFDGATARALNGFVFYLAQPCLMAYLASTASIAHYKWDVMGVYLAAELLAYVGFTLLFRLLFGFDLLSALLLAMAGMFINHFYFVLPIAERLGGAAVTEPIQAVAFVDAALLFCGTIFVLELIAAKKRSLLAVPLMLARNPTLLGLAAGLAMNLGRDWTPAGLTTFAEFAGKAAAPAILFALGLTLANVRLFERDSVFVAALACKMLAVPLIFGGMLYALGGASPWVDPLMFLSAGPSGAMAFVLALQYNAPQRAVDVTAKAVLASTLLSVLTLALLSPLLQG
ncbi:MAG: AEC family transporter [Neomegalonema sp.]|nr:AEC family transporter [Neomegalonema sp.]